MSTYVLVHGAWHGSWCWEKVVPLLEGAGHQVEVLDLPGCEFIEVRQGLVQRVEGYFDRLSMLRQLGLVPVPGQHR